MKQRIVHHPSQELKNLRRKGKSQTDWKRVKAIQDADIDFSDSPEITPEQFAQAIVQQGVPSRIRKTQLTLRLDADVLDWFRAQGPGYQTRINALLRAYRDAHQEA